MIWPVIYVVDLMLTTLNINNNHSCTLADIKGLERHLSILDHFIATRDLVDEGGLGVEKQHVEVLNGANALQRLPVLEPENLQESATTGKAMRMLTFSRPTSAVNMASTKLAMVALISLVKSPVSGSSGRVNLVQTTRCTMPFARPYGQSL